MYQYNDYLPEILQDSREYQVIGAAVNAQAAMLADRQRELLLAKRIGSASGEIISRWERVLGLNYNPLMTLEERRYRVLVQIRLRLVMTLRKLCEELNRITDEGATVSVDYERYTLRVQVSLKSRHNYDTVVRLLRVTMPANLVLIVQQLYNRWGNLDGSLWRTISRYTWRQLRSGNYRQWGQYRQRWGHAAAKTWRQMREDVT